MKENGKRTNKLILHDYSTQIEISSFDEAFVYYDLAKQCLNNNDNIGYNHYIQLAKMLLSQNNNKELKDELKR
ncbi:MAG: hypothetical protein PHD10_03545 [Bacilli bacterium]|nr:hypothetical protein [Bacilli bacterium]MDD4608184.1 hypothetical protein [Bacilli bacterium]